MLNRRCLCAKFARALVLLLLLKAANFFALVCSQFSLAAMAEALDSTSGPSCLQQSKVAVYQCNFATVENQTWKAVVSCSNLVFKKTQTYVMIKICSETVCQDCLMKKNCINKACVFNLNSFPSKSSRRHRQGKSQTRNLSKTRRFRPQN